MNKAQAGGKVERAVGKVKQRVGEAVGTDNLANKGVKDQVKGAAKETWGDAKDAANKIKESHQEAASEKAAEKRGKISQSVDDAKEKVKDKIEDFKERHKA
jgi:uncharacterized protein YjbJ (UPF0337 family)